RARRAPRDDAPSWLRVANTGSSKAGAMVEAGRCGGPLCCRSVLVSAGTMNVSVREFFFLCGADFHDFDVKVEGFARQWVVAVEDDAVGFHFCDPEGKVLSVGSFGKDLQAFFTRNIFGEVREGDF